MKKVWLGCALLGAMMAFSSCANKERCYEITVTANVAGIEQSTTVHERTTKNDLKDAEEQVKATFRAMGIDENVITISSKAVPDSNCD